MNPPDSAPNIIWRIQTLETDLKEERQQRRETMRQLDTEKADIKDLANVLERVNALGQEVGGLRRALLIFSLSMVGTAVTFLAVIFAVISSR